MNTAENLNQTQLKQFVLSECPRNVRDVLVQLAKWLDPASVRTYATVIGIRAGAAWLTDGFALLRFKHPCFDGVADCSLDAQFQLSQVKYPTADGVVSAITAYEIDARAAHCLAADWRGKSGSAYMRVSPAGTTLQHNSALSADNTPVGAAWFNPNILAQFIRLFPKQKWQPTDARVCVQRATDVPHEGQLHLQLTYVDLNVLLLAVAIKPGE